MGAGVRIPLDLGPAGWRRGTKLRPDGETEGVYHFASNSTRPGCARVAGAGRSAGWARAEEVGDARVGADGEGSEEDEHRERILPV